MANIGNQQHRTTRVPCMGGVQPLDWQQNIPLVTVGHGGPYAMGFKYIAPTPKWNEALRANMSSTYRGGEAYAIGHQPYNYMAGPMVANQTPAIPRILTNQQGKNRIQSSAQVLQSQLILANLLSQNSQVI